MKKICIIPARLAATRFPNKPLAELNGMSMMHHICKRCALSNSLDEIIVATCDEEIKLHVESIGVKVIMTSDSHERCTDRIEEAVSKITPALADDDQVIMVQGDEVLIHPSMIDQLSSALSNADTPIVNLVCEIKNSKFHNDVNAIKIVSNLKNEALYLSRSPIPSLSKTPDNFDNLWQQTGIIGFKKSFLTKFGQLEPTPLEKRESIDMLRVLEHGYKLQLISTDKQLIGVDNLDDLKEVENILNSDPLTKEYM
jgi:3-deoxy-manno-octulosonate cytidylyltransferase (CMP-KDO synthetase)